MAGKAGIAGNWRKWSQSWRHRETVNKRMGKGK